MEITIARADIIEIKNEVEQHKSYGDFTRRVVDGAYESFATNDMISSLTLAEDQIAEYMLPELGHTAAAVHAREAISSMRIAYHNVTARRSAARI
jgi:hypothetical protein